MQNSIIKGRADGEDAEAIATAFHKAFPDKPLIDAVYIDESSYRHGILESAQTKAAQGGAPVYNYLFAYEFPTLGGWLPWHYSEIAFAFHNIDLIPQVYGNSEIGYKVQEEFSGAFVNFVKTGNPNHEGMIEWPAFTNENGACMIFQAESRIGEYHDAELLELMLPTDWSDLSSDTH